MSTRRVVIGKYLSGAFGLKCSMPGIDALTDNDQDGSRFSFNSEWTDFVKIQTIGIVTIPPIFDGSPVGALEVFYPALPYKPFMEARRLVGNVVYDDFARGGNLVGVASSVTANSFTVAANAFDQAIYIIYKIPVPTQ